MRVKLGDDCYVDPAYVVGYYVSSRWMASVGVGSAKLDERCVRIELAGGRSVETTLPIKEVARLLDDEPEPAPVVPEIVSPRWIASKLSELAGLCSTAALDPARVGA